MLLCTSYSGLNGLVSSCLQFVYLTSRAVLHPTSEIDKLSCVSGRRTSISNGPETAAG